MTDDNTLPSVPLPEDEENFLRDQYSDARMRVEEIAKQIRELQGQKNVAEKSEADMKQAILDYLTGNGLIETENFRLGKSVAIEVPDIEAVPEEYLRIKKEINKAAIKAMKPVGNWYNCVESVTLTMKEIKNGI